jgi:hypothetical protein
MHADRGQGDEGEKPTDLPVMQITTVVRNIMGMPTTPRHRSVFWWCSLPDRAAPRLAFETLTGKPALNRLADSVYLLPLAARNPFCALDLPASLDLTDCRVATVGFRKGTSGSCGIRLE